MAGINIDDLRALPDYAPVFRWNVFFVSLPAIGVAGFLLADALNLRCESSEIPTATNQSMDIIIRSHKVKQPGKLDYSGQITLTFIETVDNSIHLLLKGWRELIWGTRSGKALSKENVEATILLQRLDNENKAVWQYLLKGVVLNNPNFGNLDSSSEVMRPSVTFDYDFFTDTPLNLSVPNLSIPRVF